MLGGAGGVELPVKTVQKTSRAEIFSNFLDRFEIPVDTERICDSVAMKYICTR